MNAINAYLNSNDGSGLISIGLESSIRVEGNSPMAEIQSFIDTYQGDYIFMALSYDLKADLANIPSENHDRHHFPKAILWVPEIVAELTADEIKFLKGQCELNVILDFLRKQDRRAELNLELKPATSKESYLEHVKQIKESLQFGDIYEMNYCQEFYTDEVTLQDPELAYFKLNSLTEAPFSAYLSIDEFVVLCGSPERYIKKVDSKLISQPIKGTIRRGRDSAEDEKLKEQLRNDPKELSENVMIVDLVRNDLSRLARPSSVKVDELFGVYSFKTVHQLISTVSCELRDEINFTDILQATFPMGSMTGAPKIRAMELIEEHEDFARGIYSGSIGYIDPKGDFDLNVVIRSVIYNSKKACLSCPVGGAITIQSDPEAEYQECFTKVQSILNGLNE